MDEPRDYHIKWSKSEKNKYHMVWLLYEVLKNDTNELICKTQIDIENKLMVTKEHTGSGVIN